MTNETIVHAETSTRNNKQVEQLSFTTHAICLRIAISLSTVNYLCQASCVLITFILVIIKFVLIVKSNK